MHHFLFGQPCALLKAVRIHAAVVEPAIAACKHGAVPGRGAGQPATAIVQRVEGAPHAGSRVEHIHRVAARDLAAGKHGVPIFGAGSRQVRTAHCERRVRPCSSSSVEDVDRFASAARHLAAAKDQLAAATDGCAVLPAFARRQRACTVRDTGSG